LCQYSSLWDSIGSSLEELSVEVSSAASFPNAFKTTLSLATPAVSSKSSLAASTKPIVFSKDNNGENYYSLIEKFTFIFISVVVEKNITVLKMNLDLFVSKLTFKDCYCTILMDMIWINLTKI